MTETLNAETTAGSKPRQPASDPLEGFELPEINLPPGFPPPATIGQKKPVNLPKYEPPSSQSDAVLPQPPPRQPHNDLKASLTAVLQQMPEHLQTWHLARVTEDAWIELVGNGLPPIMEAIRRNVQQLRDDLAGATPTPLELLVINQVVIEWLAAEHANQLAATNNVADQRMAQYRLRRAESTAQRFLRASKTLAEIRRLERREVRKATPEKAPISATQKSITVTAP